jgi:hypothetical protein
MAHDRKTFRWHPRTCDVEGASRLQVLLLQRRSLLG